MARRLTKLALGVALSFGVWKTADACLPKPNVEQIFNAHAQPQAVAPPIHEYKLQGLKPPANTAEVWRIRLGSWEMAAGGQHTFLEFAPYCEASQSCPSKDEIYQIHGIAMDAKRHDFAVLDFKRSEAYTRFAMGDYVLKAFGVNHDQNRKFFRKEPENYVDVFYGTKDEVLKKYLDAMQVVERVNRRAGVYELIDHNSNSVQRTIADGIGYKVPPLYDGWRVTSIAGRVWAPGINLSMLPRDWDLGQERRAGGYDHLSGDALEQKCKAVSGVDAVWKEFKPQPPKPGI